MGYTKWTYELVKEYVGNLGYELIDKKFNGYDSKISFKDIAGFLYYISFANINKGCIPPKFQKSNPYTIENIKLWCILNNKPFVLCSNKYNGNSEKLNWKCMKESCGEYFYSSLSHILRGRGCGVCHGKQLRKSNCLAIKNPKISEQWDYKKNNGLTPYDITANSRTKVWWRCDKGHSWKSQVASRNYGHGCPVCNISKNEEKVRIFLNSMHIRFKREFSFDDLRSDMGNLLRFDFCVFNLDNTIQCLIEIDGEFHYRNIYSDYKFKRLKIHDKMKNEYCFKYGYKLIRIPYFKFNKYKDILQRELALVDKTEVF
jgi:hypothetical protein